MAGAGHVHDPDALLVGSGCLNDDEARSQMAIWAISAAPLTIGADLRTASPSQRAILLNSEVRFVAGTAGAVYHRALSFNAADGHPPPRRQAIAIDQDAAVKMGTRVGPSASNEVWARALSDGGGGVAVALFKKEGSMAPPGPCPTWNETEKGCV